MTRKKRTVAVVAVAVAAAAVAVGVWWPWCDKPRPVADQTPWVELGRGSVWHGLETTRVDPDGTATLFRKGRKPGADGRATPWEMASLRLPPEAVAAVRAAVEGTGVLGLDRTYSDPNGAGGAQWVLRVRHEGMDRVVYCDNQFPPPIRQFAARLDAILNEYGLAEVEWWRVPYGDAGKHDEGLWDSIRR